ncbi:hypothetical protein [Pelagerythrobacter sp.]
MEYEIEDDPQGDHDVAEADRTGGVRENHIVRRNPAPAKTRRPTQPR